MKAFGHHIYARNVFHTLKHMNNVNMYNSVIHSTKGKFAEQVYNGSPKKGFPQGIFTKAEILFSAFEAAVDVTDLAFPPGNTLETLSGDRAGQYSIRINRRWRICFNWTAQGPENVEITDYH